MKYSPALLKAFLVFPLNVMGTIPALILWSTGKLEVLSFGLVPVIVGGGLCPERTLYLLGDRIFIHRLRGRDAGSLGAAAETCSPGNLSARSQSDVDGRDVRSRR